MMDDELKVKTLTLSECKIKAAEDGAMRFSGYASVFGGIDAYGDTIDPKAYDETLKNRERPIRMRWNHYGSVIGKWTKIEVDERGLYVEGELTPGHSLAKDVYASLKHGAIDGMSIGYYVRGYEELEEGRTLLTKIELIEISVVEEPADAMALVGDVKSRVDECANLKDIESVLRDAGRFSRSESKAIVAQIKAIAQRDAEKEREIGSNLENLFKNFSI